MRKISVASMVAGAMAAAVIGLAGPAQADPGDNHQGRDRGHGAYGDRGAYDYPWRDQLVPRVKVPRVDTSVRN